ncbi:unnamed protein product [Phaedon cochleariae]|uniref:Uncharacterized protein n=1 Tax=Phaedon cochleariae TaxID=80249 RepID=A0A9P0DJS6_PHACE|nr:unnamed protein product [Phaedon cochleariae]
MVNTKEKSSDKRRKQKRESEQRKRERIRLDPHLYEEAKRKERERYHQRKNAGKIKTINERNDREKRQIRKRWRQTSSEYRKKRRTQENLNRFLEETTPPSTPTRLDALFNEHPANIPGSSGRSAAGRKRVLRKRSQTVRKLKNVQKERDMYRRKAIRYKTKYYRMKSQSIKINRESPRIKVAELTKGQKISKEVRRQLVFGEVLKTQLQQNFIELGYSAKKKRKFIEHTSGNVIKKYRLINETKKIFGSHKIQKNKASERINETKVKRSNLITVVRKFYERDDNSRMCPGKKDTITVKKCKKQKRYLSNSLRALYEKFALENLDLYKISYATFCKLRPFWVVIPTAAKRETCLCMIHENMLLLVTKMKLLQIIDESNPEAVCRTICCDMRRECLERICETCKHKQVIFKTYQENEDSSYKKWVLKNVVINIKGVEKNCKKILKDEIKCTKGEMVKLLIGSLPKFMNHISNMNHQFKMIQDLKKKLNPETETVIHVDFSENYTCKYFREVQSAHFGGSKPQISMHTVVWYRKLDEIKPESFCTFSKNLRHDPIAIIAHLLPLVRTIRKKMPSLKRVHFCSDGPSTQYKNKSMFYLIGSKLAEILEVNEISWNYFESGHGKGAVDGVGGCLKRSADRLVACGYDVPNFEQLIFHLKESCSGIQIECVSEEQIDNLNQIVPNNLKPFKGTMQVHQLCWSIENPNCLRLRRLSCPDCSFQMNCEHYELGQFTIPNLHRTFSEELNDTNMYSSDLANNLPSTHFMKEGNLLEIPENSCTQSFPQKFAAKLRYADVYSSDSEDDQPLIRFTNQPDFVESLEPENQESLEPEKQFFEKDDFVLVEWPKYSRIHYIGQVNAIHGAIYEITFMRRVSSTKNNLIFIWPQEEDLSEVNSNCIIKKVASPQVLRRNRFLFKDDPILMCNTLK